MCIRCSSRYGEFTWTTRANLVIYSDTELLYLAFTDVEEDTLPLAACQSDQPVSASCTWRYERAHLETSGRD